MFAIENRYLKPLPAIVIGFVAAVVMLFIGSLIAGSTFTDDLFGEGGRGYWLLIAAVAVYGVYVWQVDKPIWQVGTREVVYMALGAALYGVLSWVFNSVPVPSVSLVSLRPTIIIPIFFGYAFGPVVGFFTGFAGNILGDALTGWGVFVQWDVGNGLVGLIPGLIWAFKDKQRSLDVLMWISVAVLAIATALVLINPDTENQFAGGEVRELWWVPVVGIALLLVTYYAPRLWPFLMGLLVVLFVVKGVIDIVNSEEIGQILVSFGLAGVSAVWAWLLFRGRESVTDALSDADTKTIIVWGALANVIGLGFAAFSDIFINGYTFIVAFLGEFVVAAGPNILFTILLAPLLYGAWKQAQAQAGR